MGLKENSVTEADKFLNEYDEPEEEGAEPNDEEDEGRKLQSYPSSLDWRQSGVLNPIRNQGGCGGCYAFSTVASLEALYKIKKGTLPQLSEQQLIDCSGSYGNYGCSGGLMTNSFKYLQTYKSMNRASYPYTATKGTCKYNSANGVVNTVGYKSLASGDVNAHVAAL